MQSITPALRRTRDPPFGGRNFRGGGFQSKGRATLWDGEPKAPNHHCSPAACHRPFVEQGLVQEGGTDRFVVVLSQGADGLGQEQALSGVLHRLQGGAGNSHQGWDLDRAEVTGVPWLLGPWP